MPAPVNSNVSSHREVFMDFDRLALIVVDMLHYFVEPESPD